jgi:hypothetical protein
MRERTTGVAFFLRALSTTEHSESQITELTLRRFFEEIDARAVIA